MQVLKKMKNLLHGKVYFFVMASLIKQQTSFQCGIWKLMLWACKQAALKGALNLWRRVKNKTNLSKRGGTLSGQIKKNKRTYWVSLGRLKKGLDSHRRKVVLCMEQKSSFITSIQSEEDAPGGRHITIQVYNTEKPCKRTCTGFNTKFKWIISLRHLVKLALEQCSLFNAFFFPVIVSSWNQGL